MDIDVRKWSDLHVESGYGDMKGFIRMTDTKGGINGDLIYMM